MAVESIGRPKSDHEPQPDVIARRLADIVAEVGPGNRLPNERMLAERLGVSRTALRDRLQLLESFGVLRRQSGSGTYVQGLVPNGLAFALEIGMTSCGLDFSALHSVRVGLERQAAMEAAAKGDPVLIGYLRRHVMTMERATDPEELDRADLEFHAALFDAAGNPALSFFAQALAGALRGSLLERRAKLRPLPYDQELMIRVHDAIHRAVASGSSADAAAAVDAHFGGFHDATPGPGWPADVTSAS